MKQCTAKGAHTICEILQAHADVLRDSQDIRIMSMNDDIIGLTGDGSTDAAAEDQEAIGIVLLKDGLPTNEFLNWSLWIISVGEMVSLQTHRHC